MTTPCGGVRHAGLFAVRRRGRRPAVKAAGTGREMFVVLSFLVVESASNNFFVLSAVLQTTDDAAPI